MVISKVILKNIVTEFVNNEQGEIVYEVINRELKNNDSIEISLAGVNFITSSFLNSAFVRFAENMSFNEFKSRIIFTNGQPHVNHMIKDRIMFIYNC